MQQAKAPRRLRRTLRWIGLILGIVVIAVAGYVILTLQSLPKETEKAYDVQQLGYSYHIVQRPGVVISGRPVSFEVSVRDANGPVAGHSFKGEVVHGYGLFANPRLSDWASDTYTADANGRFSVAYKSNFFSWRADSFGLNISPVFTPAEEQAYQEKLLAREKSIPSDTGTSTSFTIQSKWIGWFKH